MGGPGHGPAGSRVGGRAGPAVGPDVQEVQGGQEVRSGQDEPGGAGAARPHRPHRLLPGRTGLVGWCRTGPVGRPYWSPRHGRALHARNPE
ncbi:hypothetical protein GCM10027075_55160 [Streptomyces heilongjiangensis]